MKTLKITLALVAIAMLTVSGVESDKIVSNNDDPTYKDYNNSKLVAIDRTKGKLKTQG
ncbi:MAG: hypothetical protein ACX93I_05480 [Winogradskyella sp.]|jgi:hypothetical protein